MDKFSWSQSTLQSISWAAISSSLRRLPTTQQLKQLQFLYNWQNVSQQKVQFAQAQAQPNESVIDSATIQDLHACLLGCGQGKSHGHYLLCRSAVANTSRDISIATFTQVLKGLKTCPGIIGIFQSALTENKPIFHTTSFLSHFDNNVEAALQSQEQIGWDSFRCGFLSTQWGNLQAQYARTELKYQSFDHDSWTTTIVQQLWTHGHAMWDLCNECLHGASHEESRGKRLRLLCQRVRQLYSHEDRKYIPATQRAQYFGLPLSQRKNRAYML